ncbi:MAG: CGLD27 family protein, partial [Microcystaceae cyanobacterium]
MLSESSPCPVPKEQQPAVEYETLKDAWLFRWGTLGIAVYVRKLAIVLLMGGLISAPIAAASFSPDKRPILFSLASSFGAMVLLNLVLLRILLGWYYIRDRLRSEQVIYEESGWYDGQVWTKPTEVLSRDRLIASYEVNPIIKRCET